MRTKTKFKTYLILTIFTLMSLSVNACAIGYKLTKICAVNMIPMAFLIDQKGIIVEVNLRGESLGSSLERLLKE